MMTHENQEALCNKMTLEQQRKKIKELLQYQKIQDTHRKKNESNHYTEKTDEKYK